jgi:N-methylhydantoinase B/oxoprolinase/acetone carboxylase alpha subunit
MDQADQGYTKAGMGLSGPIVSWKRRQVSLLSERRKLTPYGLAGGQNGFAGKNILIRKKKKRELSSKMVFEAQKDDLLIIKTPGGGGWGRTP